MTPVTAESTSPPPPAHAEAEALEPLTRSAPNPQPRTSTGQTPATAMASTLRCYSWPYVWLVGGLTLTVCALAFQIVPRVLQRNPIGIVATAIPGAAGILLLLGSTVWLRRLESADHYEAQPEPGRSNLLYGHHLVVIGIALLADALISVVILTALAWSVGQPPSPSTTPGLGHLTGDAFNAAELDLLVVDPGLADILQSFSRLFGHSAAEASFVSAMFVFSTCVALLGALFFFATSLWEKMSDPQREPFDRAAFWAGLWFRLGEAVLFNLVFFLLLRIYAPDHFLLLPLVSLLVGMFLKAGEKLMAGIAIRVFSAFEALVPVEKGAVASQKLGQWRLSNLPNRSTAKEEIVRAVKAVRGTTRPVVDPDNSILRVHYDPERTSPEEIVQSLQLLGIRVSEVGFASSDAQDSRSTAVAGST
jgi:copper chaperone CopZ